MYILIAGICALFNRWDAALLFLIIHWKFGENNNNYEDEI